VALRKVIGDQNPQEFLKHIDEKYSPKQNPEYIYDNSVNLVIRARDVGTVEKADILNWIDGQLQWFSASNDWVPNPFCNEFDLLELKEQTLNMHPLYNDPCTTPFKGNGRDPR
jgi:hypothetical protein